MRQTFKYRLLLLVQCLPLFVLSQVNTGNSSNDLDFKYQPNSNSIFNRANTRNDKESADQGKHFSNVVKFHATALFRQKILFSYNRKISGNLVGEISLGQAFGPDFFQNAYMSVFLNNYGTNQILSLYDLMPLCSYSSSSPYIGAGLRIYMQDDCFEGSYVSLQYRREKAEYLLDKLNSGYAVTGSNIAQFRMTGFSLAYGYTWFSGKSNTVFNEFEMGFGIKFFEYTEFGVDDSNNTYPNYTTYYYNTGNTQTAKIIPSFNLSYAIGFGF
ncbi:MAG TPA: hypothetical protein PLQ93_05480 [Bacteroidia bacterium]|nr:hypothetical protein [Bacteroidia bacterium]